MPDDENPEPEGEHGTPADLIELHELLELDGQDPGGRTDIPAPSFEEREP